MDSPNIPLLLKVVHVWLQLPDEQRRFAGRGYDSRFVYVKLLVVRGRRHVGIQAEEYLEY